ncbi:MAG: biliverdin-producing heme oxygenase [Pirellulales bacterium]
MSLSHSSPIRADAANSPEAVLSKPLPSARLRAETAEMHSRVEKAFERRQFFRSRDTYVECLEVYLSIFQAAEEAILARLSRWSDAEQSSANTNNEAELCAMFASRTPQLAGDLQALKVERAGLRARSVDCSFIAGFVEALGAWYVLEGSALGGLFLSREIQNRLGITRDTGGSFFYGRGNEVQARWQGFREQLDACLAKKSSIDIHVAVASAQEMFRRFESEFEQRRDA